VIGDEQCLEYLTLYILFIFRKMNGTHQNSFLKCNQTLEIKIFFDK